MIGGGYVCAKDPGCINWINGPYSHTLRCELANSNRTSSNMRPGGSD